MKRLSALLILVTFLTGALRAQTSSTQIPKTFFSGYERALHGGGFIYHSPDPAVTSSMLVRSEDSTAYVEWETAEVPSDFDGHDAYFAWMFGINVTPNGHLFSLVVNGKKMLVFSNPELSRKVNWTVNGIDGGQLTFFPTMIDMYHDLMGYAVLKLPLQLVKRGKGQTLRILGESAGSPVWYMTFQSPIREDLSADQVPAVVKHDGRQYDLAQFMVTHLGKTSGTEIELSNGMKQDVEVHLGYNSFLVRIPVARQAGTITAKMELDGKDLSKEFAVRPIRDWTIYLVEHTHTDVGYAEPNDEIMAEQLRYIDYALDFCRQTDNYPNSAKFRWTCETAWAVEKYLLTRPKDQVDRLLKMIKEKRIDVTGWYLNMLDMADESTLADMLKTVRLFKNEGIDVRTVMQDDVNDAPWCLVDYLASAGIKYFSIGENPTHALRPFKIPTAFWWESPSGQKLMAFRGEHYQYGNSLGILSGDMTSFGNSLFSYLNSLENKGYPMNRALLQFSGYFIDDSPPSIKACNMVKKWNQTFEWPKLKLATITEFLNSVERHYGNQLPTYKLAWPGWWADGLGSCALETAYVRNTQSDFIVNQGLLSMAHLLGAEVTPDALHVMNSVDNNIIFYDEHTFGANESISNPLSLNSTVQWDEKSAYAWTAVKRNRLLRETSLGLLRSVLPGRDYPTITVFNTMNTKRSGVARFFAYEDLVPSDKKITIINSNGNKVPVQLAESGPGGNYWDICVTNVPPFGYETYRVVVDPEPPGQAVEHKFTGTLANKYYQLVIDTAKGGITSLIDRSSDKQLVDAGAPWELGQFIYERLANRHLLDGPGATKYSPDLFTRTSMTDVRVSKVTDGPIWKSIDITGQVKGCSNSDGVTCEIRLYNDEKRIQLVFSMTKKQVFKPEAAYVAFPFSYPNGHITFQVQGGTVVPGKRQLPGTASDWDCVQNFAAVRGDEGQIVFVSPEAPLMEFGGINTGRWLEVNLPKKPYIYSYVLNNYWDTNYKAAQEGGLRWTYDLTSTRDTTMLFATQFGCGVREPLVATYRPGGGNGSELISHAVLNFDGGTIHLVFARPAWNGKGVVLCLREAEGRNASLDVTDLVKNIPATRVYESNSLEENPRQAKGAIGFRPYQVRFLLLRDSE